MACASIGGDEVFNRFADRSTESWSSVEMTDGVAAVELEENASNGTEAGGNEGAGVLEVNDDDDGDDDDDEDARSESDAETADVSTESADRRRFRCESTDSLTVPLSPLRLEL